MKWLKWSGRGDIFIMDTLSKTLSKYKLNAETSIEFGHFCYLLDEWVVGRKGNSQAHPQNAPLNSTFDSAWLII